jgi:FtsH-binding integral membrane protein
MSKRKILIIDFTLAFSTGLIGIVFYRFLVEPTGLPANFIVIVSLFHLLYSSYSLTLLVTKNNSNSLFELLILANWFWMIVSIVLLFVFWSEAKLLGRVLLLAQVYVLGVLAFVEGKILQDSQSPSV